MPDPNNPNPQRTEPATAPDNEAERAAYGAPLKPEEPESPGIGYNPAQEGMDAAQQDAELLDILNNPDTVAAVTEFLSEKDLTLAEVEVSKGMWGWAESVGIARIELGNGSDYFVSPDEETTHRMAIALVKNDLDDQPELFNESFIRSYINEDHLRDMLRSDIEEMVRVTLTDALQSEVEEGVDPDEAFEEQVKDQVEQELADPIEYLQGIMGDSEGLKQAIEIGGVDVDEAAEDAVAADGEGHFLSSYDGMVHDLPHGGQFWRHN